MKPNANRPNGRKLSEKLLNKRQQLKHEILAEYCQGRVMSIWMTMERESINRLSINWRTIY